MASDNVVLYRMPGCFALPTIDPRALALETLLRLCNVRFTKVTAPLAQFGLAIAPCSDHASAAATKTTTVAAAVRCYDLASCVTAVCGGVSSDSNDTDTAAAAHGMSCMHTQLSEEHAAALACVEALSRHCLFHAFTFVVYADDVLYEGAVRKSVTRRVATLYEQLTRRFRRDALHGNVYACGSDTHGRAGDVATRVCAAIADAARALHALELLHTQHARDDKDGVFFLGTPQATLADVYAYAAASSFLHADFAASVPTTTQLRDEAAPVCVLLRMQRTSRQTCPRLLRYVERMRHLLYDEYSGTYKLKPLPATTPAGGAGRDGDGASSTTTSAAPGGGVAHDDVYRAGRARTLWLTAAFACVYFACTNAQTVLALLLAVLSDGNDGDALLPRGSDDDDDKEGGDVHRTLTQKAQ